jgi:hypothetical protein
MKAGSATTCSDRINPRSYPVTSLRSVPGFHLLSLQLSQFPFQVVNLALQVVVCFLGFAIHFMHGDDKLRTHCNDHDYRETYNTRNNFHIGFS